MRRRNEEETIEDSIQAILELSKSDCLLEKGQEEIPKRLTQLYNKLEQLQKIKEKD